MDDLVGALFKSMKTIQSLVGRIEIQTGAKLQIIPFVLMKSRCVDVLSIAMQQMVKDRLLKFQ